jgi:hypothetical protein
MIEKIEALGAAGDVRPEPDRKAGLEIARQRITPAPMKRFDAGQWATRVPVSTSRASSRSGQVDGVGQHGPLPEAAGTVVDVHVVSCLGEEPAHLRNLAWVLRDVRLPPGPR